MKRGYKWPESSIHLSSNEAGPPWFGSQSECLRPEASEASHPKSRTQEDKWRQKSRELDTSSQIGRHMGWETSEGRHPEWKQMKGGKWRQTSKEQDITSQTPILLLKLVFEAHPWKPRLSNFMCKTGCFEAFPKAFQIEIQIYMSNILYILTAQILQFYDILCAKSVPPMTAQILSTLCAQPGGFRFYERHFE